MLPTVTTPRGIDKRLRSAHMKKLVEVFGIVPGIALQLEQANVHSVADLAAIGDLAHLSEKTGVPIDLLKQWQELSLIEISKTRLLRRGLALLLTLVAGLLGALTFWFYGYVHAREAPSSGKAAITLIFDYDFTATRACVSEEETHCIARFNIYDISAGFTKRFKLTSIPAPPGAGGFVKGISVTIPPIRFSPGRHRLSVTAQLPNGMESDPNSCTLLVEIP